MSVADHVLMRMDEAVCQGGFALPEETGYK